MCEEVQCSVAPEGGALIQHTFWTSASETDSPQMD